MPDLRVEIDQPFKPRLSEALRHIPRADPADRGAKIGLEIRFQDPDFELNAIRDFTDEVVDLIRNVASNIGQADILEALSGVFDDIKELVNEKEWEKDLVVQWTFTKESAESRLLLEVVRSIDMTADSSGASWMLSVASKFDRDPLNDISVGNQQGHVNESLRELYLLTDDKVFVEDRLKIKTTIAGLGAKTTDFLRSLRDAEIDLIRKVRNFLQTPAADRGRFEDLMREVTDTLLDLIDKIREFWKDTEVRFRVHLFAYEIRCVSPDEITLMITQLQTAIPKLEAVRNDLRDGEAGGATSLGPAADSLGDLLRQLRELLDKLLSGKVELQ